METLQHLHYVGGDNLGLLTKENIILNQRQVKPPIGYNVSALLAQQTGETYWGPIYYALSGGSGPPQASHFHKSTSSFPGT